MNNTRVEGLQRVAVPGLILLAALVGSAGFVLPGPELIYILCAALLLLGGVLFVRGMAEATLDFLGFLSPAVAWVLSRRQRRLEFGLVAASLQRVLRDFQQPCLSDKELEEITDDPPSAASDDVAEACRAFARRLDGRQEPRGLVYELLYRDVHDDCHPTLWHERAHELHRRELAKILVESKDPGIVLENPEDLLRIFSWVLHRLPDFHLEVVGAEVEAVHGLWSSLESYAGHLRAVGLSRSNLRPGGLDRLESLLAYLDQRLRGKLLTQANPGKVAAAVLRGVSRDWILDWAIDQPEPLKVEPGDLAEVYLGIYRAEMAPGGFPDLPGLGSDVARRQGCLNILFGYLWKRSKLRHEALTSPGPATLGQHSPSWWETADREMGEVLSTAVRGVLRSRLTNRQWPTWLPILPAVDRVVQQVGRLDEKLEELRQTRGEDAAWQAGLESLAARLEEMGDAIPSRSISERLVKVQQALEEEARGPQPAEEDSMARVDRALAELKWQMLPLAAAGSFAEPRVEEALEAYAGEFARNPILDAIDRCRRGAAELEKNLESLGHRIRAEAGGGSAYVITFDQHYGPVANLIDSLAEKYGFRHYTKYSRLGMLRPGQSFESFYQELEKDLEKIFRPVLEETIGDMTLGPKPSSKSREDGNGGAEGPAHPAWGDVEVTVQQISLLHRHDFAEGDSENLLALIRGLLDKSAPSPRPSAQAVLRRVFKLPPSSALLAQVEAHLPRQTGRL